MGRKLKLVACVCVLMLISSFWLIGCSKRLSIDDCFKCTFSLFCYSESRFDSIGTAFAISQNQLATNAHVISYLDDGERVAYDSIMASFYYFDKKVSLIVEFIDDKNDFAILRFESEDIKLDTYFTIGNSSKLKIGDKLATIGNLNNYGLCYNVGVLSSYKKTIFNNNSNNDYFQTNIEISKGSSGGPVLNINNEVVGIMTFKVRDSNSEYVDGISFFIPIEFVESYLSK